MDLIDNFPDCVPVGNYLVFYGTRSIYISRGYKVYPLPLEGLSDDYKLQYRHRLYSLLTLICRDGFDIQVQRSFDADYSNELNNYLQKDTGCHEFSSYIRNCVFKAYNQAAEKGKLRREYMQLYIGKWVDGQLQSRKELNDYLHGLDSLYDNYESQISTCIDGSRVEPMETGDYYEAYFKAFNPSETNTFREVVGKENFCPGRTMMENVNPGDAVEIGNGITGITLDNRHVGFLTLNRWPSQSIPNITRPLTQLPFNEARITFNVYSIDTDAELTTLSIDIKRLENRGDKMTVKDRQSLQIKRERLQLLTTGKVQPVHVTGIVTYWAESEDALRVRGDIIKNAIRSMSGADYILENNAVGARKVFGLSMPGWLGQMPHRRLETDTFTLADLLPISSSVTGFLRDGQILFDNDNGGIVGVSLFQGNTPLHMLITGATRAGKSVTSIAGMSQIANELGYMAVVESGNSWGTFIRAMKGQSIIVRQDSSMTFNYFDTDGVPFSSSHLQFCVSICLAMTRTQNQDLINKRRGLIEKAVKILYKDRFESWKGDFPEAYSILRNVYAAIKKYGIERAGDYESFSELLTLWQEMSREFPEEKNKRLRETNEEEIVDYELKEPDDLLALACVFYTREDFPTHGSLVEVMNSGIGTTAAENEEYRTIANALAGWTKSGSYGQILDGYSNVDLSADFIQFELGEIPESSADLKAMIGFILTNRIRSEVTRRSRAEKKVFVFEEAAIILGIEGGAQLFLESLAQMAKYSCQVTIVTQQLAQFLEHEAVAKVALGNCRQFLILRNSMDDLAELGRRIRMPEQLVYRASQFRPPSDLPAKNRYASAILYNPGSGISAILRIYAPKEVLWVADSEGAKYAQRMTQLKGVKDEDLLETIKRISHE